MTVADLQLQVALSAVLPIYEIPDDDLVGEVLIPAMSNATVARIGAGFFSSHCFAQIAPGLADFINDSVEPLQLMISPEISVEDQAAIDRGLRQPADVVADVTDRLLTEAELSSSALVHHTLDCLSYLVATGRLDLRFILMRRGMYHKKMWLFFDGVHWAACHGSGNATARGLLVNGEQMTVDRPWADGEAAERRVSLLLRHWERQWENRSPHSLTLPASLGLPFAARNGGADTVPTTEDFWLAWQQDQAAGLEPELPPGYRSAPLHVLRVPAHLDWRTGLYRHQGAAVDSFMQANGRGIFEIATGGGKTRTALICATALQDQHRGPFFVLILVPSRPLTQQWADDVRAFGIEPLIPSEWPPEQRKVRFEEIRASLVEDAVRTEVLIATNRLFAENSDLRDLVDEMRMGTIALLIGDEMHNLGVASFLSNPPDVFSKRLGLSATPIRQYDPDGTDRLFDYFGPPVFHFTLADAISSGCLTPYSYHLHEVLLTDDEMDKYAEISEELRVAGLRFEDDGRTVVSNDRVERLLRQRRAVLEQAEGKLTALRGLLLDGGSARVTRTLIYTSAKATVLGTNRQIDLVNRLLADLGIIAHQFTSAETGRADARGLLAAFGRGDYQVLTAMKVLDEGIDIPQTDTAYLLASSTVRREWVQRRGRILRRSEGKEAATLHDFLVVPPDTQSSHGRSVLRGELRRAEEFVELATNEWETGGPREVISKYE